MAKEFKRENRYIVIKIADLVDATGMPMQPSIEAYMRMTAEIRISAGKPPLECVVVESDWPEYETVWKMIEERCTGKPLISNSHAAERIAASEIQLQVKHGFMLKAREERNRLEGVVERMLAEQRKSLLKIGQLKALLMDAINLCRIGDIDESTEAHGWGTFIAEAKEAIK